jgi:hypothetical protein
MGQHLRAWPGRAIRKRERWSQGLSARCERRYRSDDTRNETGGHGRCTRSALRHRDVAVKVPHMKKVLLLIVVAALATVAAKKVRAV